MSDLLELTARYEQNGDGWIVASIPEFPGVVSQGRNIEEARWMLRDALREVLSSYLETGESPPPGHAVHSESLHLTIAP